MPQRTGRIGLGSVGPAPLGDLLSRDSFSDGIPCGRCRRNEVLPVKALLPPKRTVCVVGRDGMPLAWNVSDLSFHLERMGSDLFIIQSGTPKSTKRQSKLGAAGKMELRSGLQG